VSRAKNRVGVTRLLGVFLGFRGNHRAFGACCQGLFREMPNEKHLLIPSAPNAAPSVPAPEAPSPAASPATRPPVSLGPTEIAPRPMLVKYLDAVPASGWTFHCLNALPFPRLQSAHFVPRFSGTVSPHVDHGMMWSTCNSTPGDFSGLRPQDKQRKPSRSRIENLNLSEISRLVLRLSTFLSALVATSTQGSFWPSSTHPIKASRALFHVPKRFS
jgi:hypothetical protein